MQANEEKSVKLNFENNFIFKASRDAQEHTSILNSLDWVLACPLTFQVSLELVLRSLLPPSVVSFNHSTFLGANTSWWILKNILRNFIQRYKKSFE